MAKTLAALAAELRRELHWSTQYQCRLGDIQADHIYMQANLGLATGMPYASRAWLTLSCQCVILAGRVVNTFIHICACNDKVNSDR